MEKLVDREKFLELEYQTLRHEIEKSKENMFKLVVGGAAVVPAAQSLASTYNIGAITIALPLIVVVLVLLFLSENHSMMRAGTYILEIIEPSIEGDGGWETWLSSKQNSETRTVDKMLIFAFAVLASCYFIVSVVLAVRHALAEFGKHGQYMLGGAYLAVGVVLAFYLYSQARTNTQGKVQPAPQSRGQST
jgi:uncharacterized membrane protein